MPPRSAVPIRLVPVFAVTALCLLAHSGRSAAAVGGAPPAPLPRHPTLLFAETKAGPLPVVAASRDHPVVVIDGERRVLPVSTPLVAERGARYPALLASVETFITKRTPVVLSDLSGRRTTGVEFTVKAVVSSDRDVPDCYLVILTYDRARLGRADGDSAATLKIREVGNLRAGEPVTLMVEHRVTHPERAVPRASPQASAAPDIDTCWQLFSAGVEISAHPVPEVAAFYHDRERAAQSLAVAAWRRANAGQSRSAQPFLQIPPLFDGTVPLPPSSDATLQVDAQGRVTDVILAPSFPAAAAGTLEITLHAWLFLPALRNGAPVPTRVRVPLNF